MTKLGSLYIQKRHFRGLICQSVWSDFLYMKLDNVSCTNRTPQLIKQKICC